MEGQITLRVDQRIIDQIDKDAKTTERTRAQIVRLILKKHYREQGLDVDAPEGSPDTSGENGGKKPPDDDAPF